MTVGGWALCSITPLFTIFIEGLFWHTRRRHHLILFASLATGAVNDMEIVVT